MGTQLGIVGALTRVCYTLYTLFELANPKLSHSSTDTKYLSKAVKSEGNIVFFANRSLVVPHDRVENSTIIDLRDHSFLNDIVSLFFYTITVSWFSPSTKKIIYIDIMISNDENRRSSYN